MDPAPGQPNVEPAPPASNVEQPPVDDGGTNNNGTHNVDVPPSTDNGSNHDAGGNVIEVPDDGTNHSANHLEAGPAVNANVNLLGAE